MAWTNYIGQMAVLALIVIVGGGFVLRAWRRRLVAPRRPSGVVDAAFEEVPPPMPPMPLMAPPMVAPPNVRRQQHFERIERMRHVLSRTRERELLLNPNLDSKLKVERYAMGFEFVLKVGTACPLKVDFKSDTTFRCSVFSANVPCPNFARVSFLRTANVGTIGTGAPVDGPSRSEEDVKVTASIDLWHFREPKVLFDMPTVSSEQRLVFEGQYDGRIPEGYKKDEEYRLSIMLAGYANIAG